MQTIYYQDNKKKYKKEEGKLKLIDHKKKYRQDMCKDNKQIKQRNDERIPRRVQENQIH